MFTRSLANELNRRRGLSLRSIDANLDEFFVFSVLGHEAVVEIVDHRRPESGLKIGDRLTFSVADCCGECEFCTKGLNQKCVKLFKVKRQRNFLYLIFSHRFSVWPRKTK